MDSGIKISNFYLTVSATRRLINHWLIANLLYKWQFSCVSYLQFSNRMSGLGTKTPVSCLQEYAVSKKMAVPQYELTHNGVGTHNPEFTFRVQVGLLWEEGTGRSKQEAKHRAAEKLLKTLKVDNNTAEKMEISEFNREPVENYVGQLKELCRAIHYPEPKYYLEESSGPSHNRVFKMVCCVSQMQEFGISSTKKQAKQQAASKMLQQLKEVGGKKIQDCLNNLDNVNRMPSQDEEVIEKYNALKSNTATTCADPVALYKDNYRAYIGLKENSPTLTKLLKESNIINFEASLDMLQEISNELGVELSTIEIPNKTSEITFSLMTMSVCPPVGGVGLGREQAGFNLLNTLLVLCKE